MHLVDPLENETIIDSCAAPGGISSYMAEKKNNTGSILSLDSNKSRLNRLNSTISRLHITNTETNLIDITKVAIPLKNLILMRNVDDKIALLKSSGSCVFCDLNQGDFKGNDLKGVDLRYAILSKADLKYTNLNGANLDGVDLRNKDLTGEILR